jgi:rubrerythrin
LPIIIYAELRLVNMRLNCCLNDTFRLQYVNQTTGLREMTTFELLALNEEAIAALYNAYASRFTESRDLWLAMAAEERQHASWIREIDAMVQRNSIEANEKRFPREAIESYGRYLTVELNKVQFPDYTLQQAFTVAGYIENSLMELKYFEVIKDDSAPVKDLLKKLEGATKSHVSRLVQASLRAKPQT